MNAARMPGFTGEASIYRNTRPYRESVVAFGGGSDAAVRPSMILLDGVPIDWYGFGSIGDGGGGGGGGGWDPVCPTEVNVLREFCRSESAKCAFGVDTACRNVQTCCGSDAGPGS